MMAKLVTCRNPLNGDRGKPQNQTKEGDNVKIDKMKLDLAMANMAYSAKELSQKCGVSQVTIVRITKGVQVSDGKLMETQTANYFSDIYPIDCAVLSANAYSCQKGCTLLSILFSAGNAKGHGSHHETHGPYEKFSFSPACRPEREDEPGRWRQSPHPPSASGSRSFLHSKRYRRNRRARTLHHG